MLVRYQILPCCNRLSVSGFSLLSVMISMLLGTSLLTALASMVGNSIAVNVGLSFGARLNEELTTIAEHIGQDLRRAGYWQNTSLQVATPQEVENPFAGSVSLGAYPGEMANSCIVYAYDRNLNGVLDTDDGSEYFGFRLRENAIEMRIAGLSCEAKGWQDLSDPRLVLVESLQFSISELSPSVAGSLAVTLSVRGNLKSAHGYHQSIEKQWVLGSYD